MSVVGQTRKSKLVSDMSASASIAEERNDQPHRRRPYLGDGERSESSGSRRMALRPLGHFSTICKVHILFDHLIEHVAFHLLGQVLEPYSNRAIQQTNSRAYSRSTSLLGQNRRCSIAMRSLDRVESSSEIDPPGRC